MKVEGSVLMGIGGNVFLNVVYHILNIRYGIVIRSEVFFFYKYFYQLIEILLNFGGK